MYPSGLAFLDQYYEENSLLINFSDGRYSLSDVNKMIPWEFKIYLAKFSKYIDKINTAQNSQ